MLSRLTCTCDNPRGPQYMEQVFASLHGVSATRQGIKLFCARRWGRVGLYLEHPAALCKTIEKQIHGQYPAAELKAIERPMLAAAADRQVWHRRLTLRPDLFPIKRYGQYEDDPQREFADPLTAIFEALNDASSDDIHPIIEIAIRPASRRRRRQARRAVQRLAGSHFRFEQERSRLYARGITHHWGIVRLVTWLWGLRSGRTESPMAADDVASSATRAHEREDELTAASDKVGGFLYVTTLRVAVAGPSSARRQARRKLDELCGVVSATAIPRLAGFRASKSRRTSKLAASVRGRPFLLSARELATLFHPPTRNVAAENLAVSDCCRPEPPAELPNPSQEKGTIALGRVRYRDRQQRFGISAADRRRHVYVLGKTGMGKSTLIENMLVTDIHADRGVGLIDPHGDLAERVARSVPQKHWHKVVLVDPADTEYPVAFNPLDGTGLDATQRALLASAVLGVFKTMFAEAFQAGYRMEDIFRNAFLALVEAPDATLLSLPRLLDDEAYRTYVASRLTNDVVREFWLHKFPGWSKRYRSDAVGPVENKVRGLMSNPLLQPILGQGRSKLRLRQVMDEGKILIVNLSKGNCGADASDLLGRLLVANIQQAAMSRSDTVEEDRRDFYLYVDEFQNYATESFETILSEARKYRLNLTLAHQYLGQLDRGLRDAVMGNVGTMISFAVGGEDAEALAGQFHSSLAPTDFVHLPKYQAYVALMVAGRTCDPFLMQSVKPPTSQLSDANFQTLVSLSRQRYAHRKANGCRSRSQACRWIHWRTISAGA